MFDTRRSNCNSPCGASDPRFLKKALLVYVFWIFILFRLTFETLNLELLDSTTTATEAVTTTVTTTTKATATTTAPASSSAPVSSQVSVLASATATAGNGRVRPISNPTKLQQIENYKVGKALLLNIHAVHHGGTSFCRVIGKSGGPVTSPQYPEIAPEFACWIDKPNLVNNTEFSFTNWGEFHKSTPVKYEKTGDYVQALRPHYHMTSWEYNGVDKVKHKLSDTNWEHPDLVSVVITRDPLSRLLAGDMDIEKLYRGYDTGLLNHSGWWDYASNPKRKQADNFFLRIIGGIQPTNRKYDNRKRPYMYSEDNLPSVDSLRGDFDIDESHYQNAVSILNRFTFLLDIACLDDGLDAITDLLGLNRTVVDQKRQFMNGQQRKKKKRIGRKNSTKARIGYDDVYEYLLEKNQWDIKLYEYSKTISLVDCDKSD